MHLDLSTALGMYVYILVLKNNFHFRDNFTRKFGASYVAHYSVLDGLDVGPMLEKRHTHSPFS